MNPIKGTLVFLAIFPLLLPASAQVMPPCDSTGKYCFADSVYDCVNGVPEQVEYCKGACEAGRCIDEALAPDVTYADAVPPNEAKGSDWIPIITLAIAGIAILAFSIQMIKAKRRAEG